MSILKGLSETHFKDKPTDYYNQLTNLLEYTNRTRCEKGGICVDGVSQNRWVM